MVIPVITVPSDVLKSRQHDAISVICPAKLLIDSILIVEDLVPEGKRIMGSTDPGASPGEADIRISAPQTAISVPVFVNF